MGIIVGAAVGKDVGNELEGLAVGGTVGLNNWSMAPKTKVKIVRYRIGSKTFHS